MTKTIKQLRRAVLKRRKDFFKKNWTKASKDWSAYWKELSDQCARDGPCVECQWGILGLPTIGGGDHQTAVGASRKTG